MTITGDQDIECPSALEAFITMLHFHAHEIAASHFFQIFDFIGRESIEGNVFGCKKGFILVIDELEFIIQSVRMKFRDVFFAQYFFHDTDGGTFSTFRIPTQNGQGLRNIIFQQTLTDELLERKLTVLYREHITEKLIEEERTNGIFVVCELYPVMAVEVGRERLQDKMPLIFIEHQNSIGEVDEQLIARLDLIDIDFTFEKPHQPLCLGCVIREPDPFEPFLYAGLYHELKHNSNQFFLIGIIPKSGRWIVSFKNLRVADVPVLVFHREQFDEEIFVDLDFGVRSLKRRSF